MMELTQVELKKLLSYDASTGLFTWKLRRQGVRQGSLAGYKNNSGYVRISLHGRFYLAHRLAWLYVHGYVPKGEIDHINRIRDDNRIENLREASRTLNALNTGEYKNNSSGSKGVYFNKSANKWQAQIMVSGKRVYLGLYDDVRRADIAFRIAHHFRLAKVN